MKQDSSYAPLFECLKQAKKERKDEDEFSEKRRCLISFADEID
ncbi:hypothetical protein [Flavobacterium silvaticum]|nr:hypothetical protein [Flavobacterium silvaticum]